MNVWRTALSERVRNNGTSIALVEDQVHLTWNEISQFIDELSTTPISLQHPVILAGQRNYQIILLMVSALANDIVGLNLEKSLIASTLPRLTAQLPIHHLVVHEADLDRYAELFRRLQYDLGQALVLDAFTPDKILGRPAVISRLAQAHEQENEQLPVDCGWLLMTSGSTADPKLVMVDRSDLVGRAHSEVREFSITPSDRILNVLPVSHDVGFNQILSWLNSGCTLLVQGNSSQKQLRKNLAEGRVTGVSGTPLMWSGFIRGLDPTEKFESVRYVTISGGIMPMPERMKLKDVFPRADVYRTYGQTETFRSLIQKNDLETETHGSPPEGVRLRIVDDSGRELSGAMEGQLVHSGVGTMLGYLDHVLKKREVYTGDYFVRTQNGQFKYLGRRDDLIKRWEVRMYLSEVEDAILKMNNVLNACVLSRPVSDNRQHELAAFVVHRDSSAMPIEQIQETIKLACSESLPASKIPDEIFVLPEFPKTQSQKVDRVALRKIWESKNAKSER